MDMDMDTVEHHRDRLLRKDSHNLVRPCAVIGPQGPHYSDRQAQVPLSNMMTSSSQQSNRVWPHGVPACSPLYYQQRPPAYPARDISPRHTFQENMNRVVVPPPTEYDRRSYDKYPSYQSPTAPAYQYPQYPVDTRTRPASGYPSNVSKTPTMMPRNDVRYEPYPIPDYRLAYPYAPPARIQPPQAYNYGSKYPETTPTYLSPTDSTSIPAQYPRYPDPQQYLYGVDQSRTRISSDVGYRFPETPARSFQSYYGQEGYAFPRDKSLQQPIPHRPPADHVRMINENPQYCANPTYPDPRTVDPNYHRSISNPNAMRQPLPVTASHMNGHPDYRLAAHQMNSERFYDQLQYQKYYDRQRYASFNPLAKIPTQFSPDIISPANSTPSADSPLVSNQVYLEDPGYVSQCSTGSAHSAEYLQNSVSNICDKRRIVVNGDACLPYGYPGSVPNRQLSKSEASNDESSKPSMDLRQFLQMWDEEYEDPNVCKISSDMRGNKESSDESRQKNCDSVKKNENSQELYVLDKVNISREELHKYEHLQKVTRLPDNIVDVQKSTVAPVRNVQQPTICRMPPTVQKTIGVNQTLEKSPVIPSEIVDVESKITQSIIHKEVKCNFDIKPCSPGPTLCDVQPNAPAGIEPCVKVDIQYSSVQKNQSDSSNSCFTVKPIFNKMSEWDIKYKMDTTRNSIKKSNLPGTAKKSESAGKPIKWKSTQISNSNVAKNKETLTNVAFVKPQVSRKNSSKILDHSFQVNKPEIVTPSKTSVIVLRSETAYSAECLTITNNKRITPKNNSLITEPTMSTNREHDNPHISMPILDSAQISTEPLKENSYDYGIEPIPVIDSLESNIAESTVIEVEKLVTPTISKDNAVVEMSSDDNQFDFNNLPVLNVNESGVDGCQSPMMVENCNSIAMSSYEISIPEEENCIITKQCRDIILSEDSSFDSALILKNDVIELKTDDLNTTELSNSTDQHDDDNLNETISNDCLPDLTAFNDQEQIIDENSILSEKSYESDVQAVDNQLSLNDEDNSNKNDTWSCIEAKDDAEDSAISDVETSTRDDSIEYKNGGKEHCTLSSPIYSPKDSNDIIHLPMSSHNVDDDEIIMLPYSAISETESLDFIHADKHEEEYRNSPYNANRNVFLFMESSASPDHRDALKDATANDNFLFKSTSPKYDRLEHEVMDSDSYDFEHTRITNPTNFVHDMDFAPSVAVDGLELGGCWIDDIACVETVGSNDEADEINDEKEEIRSPETSEYLDSDEYSQQSDNVMRDSNENIIAREPSSNFDKTSDKYEVLNDSTNSSFESKKDKKPSIKLNIKKSVTENGSESEKKYEIIQKDRKSHKRVSSKDEHREKKKRRTHSSERSEFKERNVLITKGAKKYIPPTDSNLKYDLSLLDEDEKMNKVDSSEEHSKKLTEKRMVLPKKIPKPKFEDVLKNIDVANMSWNKMKLKRKKVVPKMVIKKDDQGSHYASSSNQNQEDQPETWQPSVQITRDSSIDKLVGKCKDKPKKPLSSSETEEERRHVRKIKLKEYREKQRLPCIITISKSKAFPSQYTSQTSQQESPLQCTSRLINN